MRVPNRPSPAIGSATVSTATAMLCVVAFATAAMGENRSLARLFPEDKLRQILLPRESWFPFPRATDRPAWEAIPDRARQAIVKRGEQYAGQEVPRLPATLYLEYRRMGNRSNYQDVWFERRRMLCGLVLAECMEGRGRFLDPLANVIWAICEESSWTWPAHIGPQKAGSGLPEASEPIVALFSAETASTLAWTVYLLRDQLDSVSPQICRRVHREVDQRILTPFYERDDFGWMGFDRQGARGRPNNWNPWINSNVLAAALVLERKENRRLQLVSKVLRCLDNFLVPYPADGSCDEGPSYWGRAGASLFDNLEWLYSVTDRRFDVYDDEVIKDVGRFIYRTHIAEDYFVNLGDCDARIDIPRELVFRYGRRIGDPHLGALAAAGWNERAPWETKRGIWSLGRALFVFFNHDKIVAADAASAPLLRDVWLSDVGMQLMAAREAAGSARGLYVASWAGHNGQSHNHNDVGNFLVYAHGRPFIIDVGRPTYSRQTFSRDRYKIWAMQSDYHNLPTVNGYGQLAGATYAAKKVTYQADDTLARLTMDIRPAYPRQAGITSWIRTVRLVRGDGVQVEDTFRLDEPTAAIVQNLVTPCEVSKGKAGQLTLTDSATGTSVHLDYAPAGLTVDLETIELDDPKLTEIWGPRLIRIRLGADSPQDRGEWRLRLALAE